MSKAIRVCFGIALVLGCASIASRLMAQYERNLPSPDPLKPEFIGVWDLVFFAMFIGAAALACVSIVLWIIQRMRRGSST